MNLKKKSIPSKNYLYFFLIIFGTFLLTFYVYLWYKTYKEDELNKSIMTDYLTVINYNELDNYVSENGNAVIYVTKLGNKDIISFEKKFKNFVSDNSLKNVILFLDVSSVDSIDYSNKLGLDNKLPYIVVYTDGKITNKYCIFKNNYNIKKIEKYLNRIGVTQDD